MALIKCPECGKDISDRAPVCIHCGYPVAELGQDTADKAENFRTETMQDEASKKPHIASTRQIPVEGHKRESGAARRTVIFIVFLAVVGLIFWALTEWWFVIPIVILVILIGVLLYAFFPLSPKEIKSNWDEEKYNGYKFTCPACGSNRVKYIGTINNSSSFATTGIARSRDGKLYECDDCKHKW